MKLAHKRTGWLAGLGFGAFIASLAITTALHAEAAKPNVVVILADDLGYGDLRCYNPDRGRISTPHLDRLAAQGLRFTDAHSSSGVCSPSRYTLLTGRYHWRTRLQSGIVGVWGKPLIAPDRLTIASLAQQQGYRTACIGKWHLGWDWPIADDDKPHFHELAPRGIRPLNAKGEKKTASDQSPVQATDANRAAWRMVFSQPIPGGPTTRGFDLYFGTDVPNWPPYCFLENNRTIGIPTELLPPRLLHGNLASLQGPALADWTLEPILPALRDRACRFIEQQAAAKQPFLLYMPLTTPHTPLAVNEPFRGQSGLDNAAADLIIETDAAVGRVLEALDQSGVADQTLVVFTSDNGFAPYVGAKQLEQRGHYPSGPLRDYKGSVYEGGHREPFVVRWPPVVKAGTVCGQLVHHADLLATLADLWDVDLPDDAGEDSFSLLPLLKGEDRAVREYSVSCASSGVPSLRQGSWKLILNDPLELYDLASDLSERRNTAAEHPERVSAMQKQLEQLIVRGRSTPGKPQKNDVRVKRYAAK